MRKKLIFLVLVLLVLCLPAFAPRANARAQINGVTGITLQQKMLANGNVVEVVTGNLTDGSNGGRADYDSGLGGTTIQLRYELSPDAKTTGDLNNGDILGTYLDNYCKVNPDGVAEGKPGYNSFFCETKEYLSLKAGIYAYVVGGDGLATWTPYMTQAGFQITGKTNDTITASYALSNVVVTNNTGSALVTIGFTAQNADPAAQYILEIGTATAQSSGSTYNCTTTTPRTLSGAIQSNSLQANFTLTTPSAYCVQLRQLSSPTDTLGTPVTVSGGASYFKDSVGAATNGIFTILGATLNPNATLDKSANPTGCVTNSDNSNYCMLAPLPGLGDGSGNLAVTNFGTYIRKIIEIVFGLIGVLSVFMIVFGGIEYMTGTSAGEKEGGKSRITNAIFGLLLALVSFIILNTLNPNLVSLGVTIPNVQVSADVDTFTPTSGGGTAGGTNVTTNITTYDSLLQKSSTSYGVECTLMKAFMYAESGGNPNATSGVGAKGLIQLMPATFTGLGYDISKISDPATNIDAAAKYVSELKSTACNGTSSNTVCNASDKQYIAAAYNGGSKANGLSSICQKGQGVNTTAWQCTLNSGYAQTRVYAPRVVSNYQTLMSNGWGC